MITFFILSQILVFFALISDFLSFQFKKREHTFLCFIVSASLISAHYFLLGKIAAGVIVSFSVMRFIVGYFSANKKFAYLFITLNTIALFFTYSQIFDLIIYAATVIMIFSNFQENNKLMRQMFMVGTSLIILYNIIIFSPMAVILESSFLTSNFIGYYRYYIKKKAKKSKK